MTIPLYIFEARYRMLVRYCQEQKLDQFIITLANKEALRDSQMPFHSVGSLIRILEVSENADGTFSLLGHGQERCQLSISSREDVAEPEGASRPLYFSEKILLPLRREDPNSERIAAWDALEVFREYAKIFFAFDALTQIEQALPEDLLYQASFMCANIRVPAEERQILLESPSLLERFQMLRHLMEQHLRVHKPPKDL